MVEFRITVEWNNLAYLGKAYSFKSTSCSFKQPTEVSCGVVDLHIYSTMSLVSYKPLSHEYMNSDNPTQSSAIHTVCSNNMSGCEWRLWWGAPWRRRRSPHQSVSPGNDVGLALWRQTPELRTLAGPQDAGTCSPWTAARDDSPEMGVAFILSHATAQTHSHATTFGLSSLIQCL